jgi:WD40 repeat protein
MMKGMTTTRLSAAVALLLMVGLAAAGVGVLASPKEEPKAETPPQEARRAEPSSVEPVDAARADLHDDPLPTGALARFGTTRLRHPGAQQVIFGSDGKTLLSTGRDLTVRNWQLSSGKLAAVKSFTLPDDDPFIDLSSPVLSPDGKTLAYVATKHLFFFDAASGKELHRLTINSDPGRMSILKQAFTPDCKQFAVTSAADEFLLFDVTAGKPIPTGVKSKKGSWLGTFAFDAAAHRLASYDDGDKTVTLWEIPTGKRLHTIRIPDPTGITDLAFAPDGKRLFAASNLRKGFVWDTATCEKAAEFPIADYMECAKLAVSADGAYLAVASSDGVVLHDATTLKHVRKLTDRFCLSIWFSPDGRHLQAPAVARSGCGTLPTANC